MSSTKTSMSLVFSVDDSNCPGLAWWIILLIVLGSLILLATIALVVILKTKSLRRKVFPFSKRNEGDAATKDDAGEYTSNKSYKGKGKVNPVYAD